MIFWLIRIWDINLPPAECSYNKTSLIHCGKLLVLCGSYIENGKKINNDSLRFHDYHLPLQIQHRPK